jgi:MFS family permease
VHVGGYTKLLGAPGVPRLAASFLALGSAATMTPVAFVLFAREATHSFASASLVLAASTAGGLLFGPARGRLVDRVGPRDAVLVLAVPDVMTDIGFIVSGHARLGAGALAAVACVAGAVTAPASAALRSVWSQTLGDTGSRQAGYALMTMMQETTFIAGPLIAGGAIALWSPTAAVGTAAGLSFIGAAAFATAWPAGKHERAPARRGRLPALAGRGMRTVVATSAAFGLTFGALDVAFPAIARGHGSAAAAGILLSGFAVGSWIGGFLYGLRPRATSAGEQYPRLCLLATIGLAPLIIAPSLPVMVGLSVLSGVCFAPITTCQLAVIDEVAPLEHRAEAFTWLGTLYGTGLALGAAVAGQLIAGAGARAGLVLACGATLIAWLVAIVRGDALRPAAHTARDPAGAATGTPLVADDR